MAHRSKNIAYLYLLITVSIWGGLYVVGKFALEVIPPFTLLFLRYLIAGTVLTMIARRRPHVKIERQDYKVILFIGVVGYFISIGAQMIGMKLAEASVASLINSMSPVFVIVFAVPFLKERITKAKLVAVLASVAGAYLIIGGAGSGGQFWGIVMSFISVSLWSLMSVLVRRITQKYDALTVTAQALLIAMVCSVPVSLHELTALGHLPAISPALVLAVLFLGLIGTALAHVLWNQSLSMIEAGTCSLFYPVQPIVSALLGSAFLGEQLSGRFLIGAALIIGGVLCGTLSGLFVHTRTVKTDAS